MKKIILTKGLPASGKSTWAKMLMQKHPGQYKRVNKDDLRALLDDSKWSKDNEKFVLNIRDYIIEMALLAGKHIIVDDTNLHLKHEVRMKEIAKIVGNTEVIIKDFTNVSIEVCIERDLKRPISVGEKVIRKMYNEFIKPKTTPEIYNPGLTYIILCDLDGTLCLFGNKNPYERDFENDLPNGFVKDLITRYLNSGIHIRFFSGRSDKHKNVTTKWLTQHIGVFDGQIKLVMRKDGDFRPDHEVKLEMYNEHVKDKYNVLFVIDDRLQVCQLWHSLGLNLFRVGDPDANF